MTSNVLPKEMFAVQKRDLMNNVERQTLKLFPVSASSSTSFSPSGNRRITFQIPSLPNAMLDPQQTFMSYKVHFSAAGKTYAACPFRELVVRTSNGKVLERIQEYQFYWTMKSTEKHSAEYDDYLKLNGISSAALTGKTDLNVTHSLESGIFSDYGSFLPLSGINGFAYEITLEIDGNSAKFSDDTSIAFENVCLYANICILPPDVMSQVLANEFKLDYESVTEHVHSYSSATDIVSTINDASPNVSRVDAVLVENLNANPIFRSYVLEQQITFQNKSYPLEKLINDNSTTSTQANPKYPALFYTISQLGKRNVSLKMTTDWDTAYRISQTFTKTRDPNVISGINTMSNSPIQIKLRLDGAGSGSLLTFVKKSYALVLKNGSFDVEEDYECNCS